MKKLTSGAIKCCVIFVGFILSGIVQSLNPDDVREGPCIVPPPAKNIDFDWLANWPMFYFLGGSRYMLYRIASANPDFPKMNEYNFYYDFCCTGTWNFTSKILHSHGFGTSLGTYIMHPVKPGVINYVPQPPIPGAGQTVQGVITFTDNKSFIFLYKCWLGSNQRGWDLFTTSPTAITLELETQIKRHAISLGLDKRQFQFLRYGNCQSRPEYSVL